MRKVIVALALCACSSYDIDTPRQGRSRPSPSTPDDAFGTPVSDAIPPPPISGGTLAVNETFAVASDPDRDSVHVVSLATRDVATVALNPHDEPGRVAIDGRGHAHVALRAGGAVVTIDLPSASIVDRTPVCSAPRGVAYDARIDAVWVACAGGELVALPSVGGAALVSAVLPRDLRDVVVQKDGLLVTRFRSAEVLYVTRTGAVDWALRLDRDGLLSTAAWRATSWSDGNVGIVHQRARVAAPAAAGTSEYYAPPPPPAIDQYDQDDSCGGPVVEQTITVVGPSSSSGFRGGMPNMPQAVLPVDVALAPEAATYAVAAAGNAYTRARATVYIGRASDPFRCAILEPIATPPGEAIAVAYTGAELLVQMRDPAVLYFANAQITVPLSDVRRRDTGHAIFHANSGHDIACASCHLEGGEDGVVWDLPNGARRTPSLRGTLAGTAPYHWQGEFEDLKGLFHDVMATRMGGPTLSEPATAALSAWLERLPAPAPLVSQDPDAVARGRALFESAAVGCTTCHSGPLFTDNRTLDVGTGAPFQVPSLVGLGWRAPYLHDGHAATLLQRFQQATDAHGHTKDLPQADLDALIAYLETL